MVVEDEKLFAEIMLLQLRRLFKDFFKKVSEEKDILIRRPCDKGCTAYIQIPISGTDAKLEMTFFMVKKAEWILEAFEIKNCNLVDPDLPEKMRFQRKDKDLFLSDEENLVFIEKYFPSSDIVTAGA